jgi:hypothetical protein
MRKEDNELTAPLPLHRVEEIEVFAASVHAVIHEHNWKLMTSMPSITKAFHHRGVFQCTKCQQVELREVEVNPYFI